MSRARNGCVRALDAHLFQFGVVRLLENGHEVLLALVLLGFLVVGGRGRRRRRLLLHHERGAQLGALPVRRDLPHHEVVACVIFYLHSLYSPLT